MAEKEWAEEKVRVGGTELAIIKGGKGKPLLLLHGELGWPGWTPWNSALAKERTLIAPIHPGFGKTAMADWIMSIRDLAGFYQRYVREQKLGPVDVLGHSLGGWIAAEMAAANPAQFNKMILVAPAGVRPPQGEIMDMFTVTAPVNLTRGAVDPQKPDFTKLFGGEQTPEQYEAWEEARAETARLAWAPYMFNPSLPHLLEGTVKAPTLIVWGRDDKVVPISAAQVYHKSIKNSRLLEIEGCGHRPEIEKSDLFTKEVQNFLG